MCVELQFRVDHSHWRIPHNPVGFLVQRRMDGSLLLGRPSHHPRMPFTPRLNLSAVACLRSVCKASSFVRRQRTCVVRGCIRRQLAGGSPVRGELFLVRLISKCPAIMVLARRTACCSCDTQCSDHDRAYARVNDSTSRRHRYLGDNLFWTVENGTVLLFQSTPWRMRMWPGTTWQR